MSFSKIGRSAAARDSVEHTGPAMRHLVVAVAALLFGLQAANGAAQPAATPGPKEPPGKKVVFYAFSGAPYVFYLTSDDNPLAKNATDQPGNISGVWLADREPRPPGSPPAAGPGELRTMEGDPPPMQPWVAAKYNERVKAEAAGRPFASTMAACLPQGMPGMALRQPYPIQIIQSPGQVTTIHELMHSHRIILLDEKLPEDPSPSFMGTSVGHWEGDTLVVTTIGIRDDTTIGGGIPHTEELRTVERIRRLDPDTLEVIITLDDPKAFTKPWSMRGTAKLLPPAGRPMEYICDNQRNPVDEEGVSGADVR